MKDINVYVQIPADSVFQKEVENVITTAIEMANQEMTRLRIRLLPCIHTIKGLTAPSDSIRESDLAIFAVANGSDIRKVSLDAAYKIGYFWISGKDVILLLKGKECPDPHTIPSTSAIFAYWDQLSLKKVKEELPEKIKQTALKRIATWPECYSIACFQDRSASQLTNAISNAGFSIDLLTTNLQMFTTEPYLESLDKLLKKKPRVEVRILTLDPQSVFAAYRARQLGLSIEGFREQLSESLKTLHKVLAGRVEIRTYDDFPTQITFIIDESVYCCTVARAIRSRNLCTFKLRKDAPGVERSFIFHFSTLWTMARPYGRV